MTKLSETLPLPSHADTADLGHRLARLARPGDCVLLRGQIGAGKSTLARAFIQYRLGEETDVPSPTYTLVQTYDDDGGEIWHADLYRLGDGAEALELGLLDAMDTAICLIEWPEILGAATPATALDIALSINADHRVATLSYGEHWSSRLKGLPDVT